MKKRLRKFILFIILLLIAVIALVWFFQPNHPIVTGKMVMFPEEAWKDFSRVKFYFSLYTNGEELEKIAEYSTWLEKDGTFKFKVRQRGKYILEYAGCSYIWPSIIHGFRSSHSVVISYFYDFQDGQVFDIGEIYLTTEDAISITSPKLNAVYNDSNDIIFEWSSIPFAQFYTLDVFRVADEEKFVINTQCVENRMSYRRICSLPMVEQFSGDRDLIMRNMPFNGIFNDLVPGKYEVRILAFREISDKFSPIVVAGSSRVAQTYFFVE